MKQVLLRKSGIEVCEVPRSLVEDGHVLVSVAYSLISNGTELTSITTNQSSLVSQALAQPEKVMKLVDFLRKNGVERTIAKVQGKLSDGTPLGYSCSGWVVQVGAGVKEFQIGDRVACAGAGKANHAECVLIPGNLLVRIPDEVSFRDAASTTLGSIALQGVRRADLRLGEWAAVIGLGLLGQLTIQILRASGVKVIGFDLNPERVSKARDLGFQDCFISSEVNILTEVLNLTRGHGVDATILTASAKSDELTQQAMEMTRQRGKVVVVGAVGLGLKRSPFYEKEIDFLIARSYGPGRYDPHYEEAGLDYPYPYIRWTENRNMAEYLHLLAVKTVDFGTLVEAEFPFLEAEKAYQALKGAKPPLSVVLRYHEECPLEILPEPKISLSSRSVHSGQQIRVAIIGAGSFVQGMHLPNLRTLSEQYNVQAIVSRTGSTTRNLADQFKVNYITAEYEQVLADPNIDMVLIATRHNLHAEQAIQAARAGKAIFVEKPMAITLEELDRLEVALRETGVPFIVGFNRRFSPAARRAKEILDNHPGPRVILYRVNAGYLPSTHWTQTREGGGRIIGEACHMIDLFQYLLAPARPIEISSMEVTADNELILPNENQVLTIRYNDGSLATLIYTAIGSNDLPKEYLEIYFGRKTLVLDDFRSLKMYGAQLSGWNSNQQDKGHINELRSFAEYIIGKAKPPITLDELLQTTRITFDVVKPDVIVSDEY